VAASEVEFTGENHMDEVPIATNNPVNLIVKKPESAPPKTRKDRIKDSLKNFFMMLPLAMLVVAQFYFLGKSFGEFSTFPLTSVTTYIFFGSILLLLLFSQMLMRSIIYSTLAGIALIAGLYVAWFGEFLGPITENFNGISEILKSAWSRKDLPYNLLMTGAMTAVLAGIAFLQFFASLIVKSFFEMLFGKEWGDGRVLGFIGAVALLAGVHLGFYSYSSMSSQANEKVLWARSVKYQPVEKFITRVPGSCIIGKDRIWAAEGKTVTSIDANSGKQTESRPFQAAVVHKGFQFSEFPVFAGSDAIVAFNRELSGNAWKTPYPASFPGLDLAEEKKDLFSNVPITTRFVNSGQNLLVHYDFGYVGMYDAKNGEQKWFRQVDLQVKINRVFPEVYLEEGYFLEADEYLLFSCHNGLIRCLNRQTGEQVWQYQHGTPKVSGKSQRGFLSPNGKERVVVAFRSGEILTLGLSDGRKIYQAVNQAYAPASPLWCRDQQACFLTDEGIFYQIDLDGGATLFNTNTLPRRTELLPVVHNLASGIVAHRDEVLFVDTEARKVSRILKSENRVFVTRPVVVDKLVYIGTQDGWVYCVHAGSRHEKWRIHVKGELVEDSLEIIEESLLVKTRSGSLLKLNRSA